MEVVDAFEVLRLSHDINHSLDIILCGSQRYPHVGVERPLETHLILDVLADSLLQSGCPSNRLYGFLDLSHYP